MKQKQGVVRVFQLGARRHYAVPRALFQMGLLDRLMTDACAGMFPLKWLEEILPIKWRPAPLRRVLERRVSDIPVELISGLPWFAIKAIWARKHGEAQADYWARRNGEFCSLVVQQGFGSSNTVYAFNGAALEIFLAAKKCGLRIVLDQTSAPWRWNKEMLTEESALWPGWEDEPSEIDESGKLSEREEREWALADRIICGSKFVVSTLEMTGGPVSRCSIVQYPTPNHTGRVKSTPLARKRKKGEPLNVLVVSTLQLRKGVQYLLQAKKLLRNENVTIRLVGPSMLSEMAMNELRAEMDVVGPVPRSEVSKHYAWADVFVLPTLSEGSANVVYEALAAGVPVITTPNAGSIIQDGINGLIVPVRDAQALAEGITKYGDGLQLKERDGTDGIRMIPGFETYSNLLRCAVAGN